MELHPAAKSSNATAQRNITEALGLPPDAPYYRITLKPPSVDPIIFGALRPDLRQCLVFVSGKSDVARLVPDRLAAPDSGWESRGSLRDASTWQRAGPADTALTMVIAAGANSAIINVSSLAEKLPAREEYDELAASFVAPAPRWRCWTRKQHLRITHTKTGRSASVSYEPRGGGMSVVIKRE